MAADPEDKSYTKWPWMVGGSNDGKPIDSSLLERGESFCVLKDVPRVEDADLLREDWRVAEETYVPRKMGHSASALRVLFFAADRMPEPEAQTILWERLLKRAIEKSLGEQLVGKDMASLSEKLRAAGASILRGEAFTTNSLAPNLEMAEVFRSVARLLELTPKCPRCKTRLVFREPTSRFMEDDNYVQCENGHVYALMNVTLNPGKDGDVQMRIAAHFLEGRLYVGAKTTDGMQFTKIEREAD